MSYLIVLYIQIESSKISENSKLIDVAHNTGLVWGKYVQTDLACPNTSMILR